MKRFLLWIIIGFSTTVFANNSLTEVLSSARNHIPTLSQPSILPVSESSTLLTVVIPAKAGIHLNSDISFGWIPAYAGMTGVGNNIEYF